MFKLEINDKEYLIEVTRRSIRNAEKMNVELKLGAEGNEFGLSYDMFYIALLKHHPAVTMEEACDLMDELIDSGDYNMSEVFELIGKQFEEVMSKLDNPNPKKKIILQ